MNNNSEIKTKGWVLSLRGEKVAQIKSIKISDRPIDVTLDRNFHKVRDNVTLEVGVKVDGE